MVYGGTTQLLDYFTSPPIQSSECADTWGSYSAYAQGFRALGLGDTML